MTQAIKLPCTGVDPELFWPHPTQEPVGKQMTAPYCSVCPLQLECLLAAFRGGEGGIWGGMTYSERLALRRYLTTDDLASVTTLNHALTVKFPLCLDCDKHRRPYTDGRCHTCHHKRRREDRDREAAAFEAELKDGTVAA
jgi:hypothetical protein